MDNVEEEARTQAENCRKVKGQLQKLSKEVGEDKVDTLLNNLFKNKVVTKVMHQMLVCRN